MKPEEKAEELVNKYIDKLEDVGTIPEEVRKNAINCSLLCVSEAYEFVADFYTEDIDMVVAEKLDYLNDVKEELETL
tara:strand:+ start:628 stop:858 length:231 start_codon:yes stop_codon:yes gene_type:complete